MVRQDSTVLIGVLPRPETPSIDTEPDTLSRRTIVLSAVAVAFVYLALRLPLLDVPLDRDEGLFGWIGQSILRGELPYRDVFDHKPPVVFYLYALALVFVPPTAAGVHGFLLVWNAATLLAVAGLARCLAGTRAALAAALAYALISAAPAAQGYTASTEMLLLLPMAAGVWLAVASRGAQGRRRLALLLGSGALAALACWIKQSAAIALLPVPALLVLRRQSDGWGAGLLDLTRWLGGGVGLSLLVIVPFLVAGVGSEFWYWSFTHSALYAEWSWQVASASEWFERVAVRFGPFLRDGGAALGLGTIGCIAALRTRRLEASFALAFVVASCASAVQSAFIFPHYLAQLFPAVALAAGVGLDHLARGRSHWVPVALAAVLVAFPLAMRPGQWIVPDPVRVSVDTSGYQAFEASPLVAEYLQGATSPEERVLIVGSEPQIAFLAERRMSNPYGMIYPLTGPYPRQQEFQRRVLDDVERDPPSHLVFTRVRTSLLMGPHTDREFFTRIEALARSRYRVVALLVHDRETREFHLVENPTDDEEKRFAPKRVIDVWRLEPQQ